MSTYSARCKFDPKYHTGLVEVKANTRHSWYMAENEVHTSSNTETGHPNVSWDDAEELSGRFRELRKRNGLTQEATAQYAGISRNAYQLLENGQSKPGEIMNPELNTLYGLAKAFHVEPAELFTTSFDAVPEDDEDDEVWLSKRLHEIDAADAQGKN